MILVRGNPEDFNRRASVQGLSDWDYTSCLPNFQKSETALFGDQSLRGAIGRLQISRGASDNSLSNARIDAVQHSGFTVTTDFNGAHQEGGGPFDQMSFPDLQFHFLPIAKCYDGKDQYRGHGFRAHVGPMKPISRGAVSLRSSDSFKAPLIEINYHEVAEDRRPCLMAFNSHAESSARKRLIKLAVKNEGQEARSSIDVLDAFVSCHEESAYHLNGTCQMGLPNRVGGAFRG